MMKKHNTLVSVAILILAVLIGFYLMKREVSAPLSQNQQATTGATLESEARDVTIDLACSDDKAITATFHLPEDMSADIVLSDGRAMNLAHVVAASGARYANEDESIVFWGKGESGFVTENGKETYSNCVVVGSDL